MTTPRLCAYAASCIGWFLIAAGMPASAFDDPIDSAGAITARIEAPECVTNRTEPVPVRVVIENTGNTGVSGTLRVRVIDDWTIEPSAPAAFTLPAGATETREFSLRPGPRVYSALYPIHAYVEHEADGATHTAHPILIFKTEFPKQPTPDEQAAKRPGWRHARSRSKSVLRGHVTDAGEAVPVEVCQGKRGLLDAQVRFGAGPEAVEFRGLSITIDGTRLLDEESPFRLTSISEEPAQGAYRMRHQFRSSEKAFDLLTEFRLDNRALQLKVWLENTPGAEPWDVTYLENVALGSWSKPVHRVYAGPGNVIEAPRIFTPGFEGHRLSTSYVGADFERGPSLVLAVDVTPDQLKVIPADRTFTLLTPHAQTLTFIPGANVWEAIKVWRDIDGRVPAGGVSKLAGRFTFDLWADDFTGAAAALEQSFRYGLTDAVVVWHRWQRWGYDYRLPDILPPRPESGGSDAFRALAETCRAHGVLFAPHDNYIDLYPDSDAFTYDRVAFLGKDLPDTAWFNRGRDAQSLRWRPDCIRPFLESNVKAIRDNYAPTAYFIDVWSSLPPHDYWTRDGDFHTRLETRDIWRESFAWIRDELGQDAPQISESGNDQLVGWADGAQANHIRVDDHPPSGAGYFVWRVNYRAAERVPWFDAAHHHRFVMQGAGYPSRYAAGLDSRLHGIYSDDYITTEVLAGRAPMVSSPFGHDVVRKYWLLHDLSQALAMCSIDSVEFVGDNLHRQCVRWDNGAEVWVNRGADDWSVEGHVLPQYGFYARVPQGVEAAIERRDGLIVEWSQSAENLYVNARSAIDSGQSPPEHLARQNPERRPVRFEAVQTEGGARLTREGQELLITPLPEGVPFTMQIDWDNLPWPLPPPKVVKKQTSTTEASASMPVPDWTGVLSLDCDPEIFAYRADPD
jgi:hypothetical protein